MSDLLNSERLRWLALSLLTLGFSLPLSAQAPTDAEVAVWAAWLGQASWVEEVDYLKVRSQASAEGIASTEEALRQRLEWASGALDGLLEETLEAFVAANRRPAEIERWLSRRLVERAGKRPKLLLRATRRSEIGFSRVGFDEAGEQALLYVESESQGTLYLLARSGGDWRIAGSWPLWTS